MVAQAPPGWALVFGRMAAGAAIAIAAVVLLGWMIDAHVLRAFSTGAVATKTNAAIGVVMVGVAVLVKVGDPPRRRRLVGDGLGLGCLVLGVVTVAEYVTGWRPGIDELLFSEAPTAVRTSSPNRMAASAALCLVVLGTAVVLLGRGRRHTAAAQWLAGVVAVLGVLALVGYGFGSSLLYQWRRSTAAAIPAGIAFLLLGSAVVAAGGGPALSLLRSRGPGGMLARRLLPLIVVIPLGVGLLLHVGGEQGWADAGLQSALAALVTIVLLTALTLAIGLRLDHVDAARAAATAELHAVNAGLEREVRTRTQELRASEELFRGAAESMFDPFAIMVAVRDDTGTIIDFEYQFANAAAAGYLDPDDVAGRRLLELFPFHRDIGLFDAYLRLVETGEPLTWESWWATLPGEDQPRAFDTRATRFGDSITYTWRDVTARERLSAALQAKTTDLERSNRDLEQFAYVASHDLQEPLRMVSSYTRLLAEDLGDRVDDTARRHLDYAHDGAVRMHRLVNDLLRFSRVGRADSRHRPVDCEQLVHAAEVDLHKAILAAEATVTHDRLPTVLGVPSELRQLFTNLVGNAVKFRGDQPAHVHLSATRDGSMYEFTVTDDGIGIDPGQAERIFEVFKRLHTRDSYPGTGIGLAICKKVVEHHGGRIWVESHPGAGSTFRFTLPADPNERGDP